MAAAPAPRVSAPVYAGVQVLSLRAADQGVAGRHGVVFCTAPQCIRYGEEVFPGGQEASRGSVGEDTLGLSEGDYHLKVQRTPPSSPPRPSDSHIGAEDGLTPQAHSALTTLLLDDSSHKAELQPYNHVCVGEYSGALRMKDLQSFQQESEWRVAQHALEQRLAEAPTESAEESALAADSGTEAVPGMKKRKRKERGCGSARRSSNRSGGRSYRLHMTRPCSRSWACCTRSSTSRTSRRGSAQGAVGPGWRTGPYPPVASGSKAPAQSEDTQRASPEGSDLSIEKDATQPTKTKKRKKKAKAGCGYWRGWSGASDESGQRRGVTRVGCDCTEERGARGRERVPAAVV
ncbi:hypothetical protein A0H81_07089 [Grifola frondosa]|uniref:Uncharacterized protein n=1 Tax=Grifola frondosa TaxID=5627 RepID=A0A1C7M7R3_GRIFR|nr:hypothetical protein A0H81_07089 [Grifola frondosa]